MDSTISRGAFLVICLDIIMQMILYPNKFCYRMTSVASSLLRDRYLKRYLSLVVWSAFFKFFERSYFIVSFTVSGLSGVYSAPLYSRSEGCRFRWGALAEAHHFEGDLRGWVVIPSVY